MSKRVKPVILIGVVFLCLVLLSGPAAAFDIEDIDDFEEFMTNSSKWDEDIVLKDNIDLSELSGSFTEIGNFSIPFKGTFDGNSKIISNLDLDVTYSNIGLFGYTENASIVNLVLEDAEVNGTYNVGGLIGYANNTTVDNCQVITGNITGTSEVGGLVGYMSYGGDDDDLTKPNDDSSNETIILNMGLYVSDCGVIDSEVIASSGSAGGLIGSAAGERSSHEHEHTDTQEWITFTYYLRWDISDCKVVDSTVSGSSGVGGLIGLSELVNVNECSVAGGIVDGNAFIGGLVGAFTSGNIINSNVLPFEGELPAISGFILSESLSVGFGGLVGIVMDIETTAPESKIENCHAEADVSITIDEATVLYNNPALVGGTGGLIGVTFALPDLEKMPDFGDLPPINGNGIIFDVRTDLDPEVLAAYLGTIANGSVSKSRFNGTVSVIVDEDASVEGYFLLGIGGLLGAGGFSEITECEAEGLIIVDTTNSMATVGVGGFSGILAANLIDDCFADMKIIVGTDSVSSPTVFVGGIGGFGGLIAANIIENSYATGTINVETTHNNGVSSADLKPLIFGLLDSFGFNIETVITDLESQIENLEDELEGDPGNETLTADLQSAREQLLIYTTLYEIDLGTVPANSGAVGGFSGLSLIAVIENCTAESDIHVIGDAVVGTGGFTGFSLIEILNKTTATGDIYVEGDDCSGVGGLVGFSVIELIGNSSTTSDVELNGTLSCFDGGFVDGDVSGLGGVGGLVGVSVWLCPLDAVFDVLFEMEFLNEKIVIDSLIENSNAQNKNVSGVFNVGRIVGLSVYFLHDQTDLLVTNLIYGGEVPYEHTHTAVISNNVYASGSMKNLYASNLVQTIPGAVVKYPGFTEMTDENLNGSLFSTINGKNASTNTGNGGSGTGSATIVDRITETVSENSGGASGSSDDEVEEAMSDEDINEENMTSKSMWWILILLAAIVLIAVGYWYYRKNNTI